MSRDWVKLHWDFYDDRKLARAQTEDQRVLGVFAYVLARSKKESDAKTNPDGRVVTDWFDLYRHLSIAREELEPLLVMLKGYGLMRVTFAGGDDVVLELPNFAKWNHPRGSAADRKALQREREKHSSEQALVTSGHKESHECHKESLEERRGEEKRGEENTTPQTPLPPRGFEDDPAWPSIVELSNRLVGKTPYEIHGWLQKKRKSLRAEPADVIDAIGATIARIDRGMEITQPFPYLTALLKKSVDDELDYNPTAQVKEQEVDPATIDPRLIVSRATWLGENTL